jgi:hypothetical protein
MTLIQRTSIQHLTRTTPNEIHPQLILTQQIDRRITEIYPKN